MTLPSSHRNYSQYMANTSEKDKTNILELINKSINNLKLFYEQKINKMLNNFDSDINILKLNHESEIEKLKLYNEKYIDKLLDIFDHELIKIKFEKCEDVFNLSDLCLTCKYYYNNDNIEDIG